jgi:hypothetical protein
MFCSPGHIERILPNGEGNISEDKYEQTIFPIKCPLGNKTLTVVPPQAVSWSMIGIAQSPLG